jgi:hypothetical protein
MQKDTMQSLVSWGYKKKVKLKAESIMLALLNLTSKMKMAKQKLKTNLRIQNQR